MTPEPDFIDPELLALRGELVTEPPTEARRRVLSRLERSLPVLAAGAATGLVVSELATAKAPLAVPAKLWLVGAFALGGAVGAVTHAAIQPAPAERTVYVDRAVPARTAEPARPEPEPIPTLSDQPGAPNELLPESPRAKRSSPPSAAPLPGEPSASLAEQQALLDRARAALGRGDGTGALETLRLHAQRFPASILTEEREALAIKALVGTGNLTEANARLASFETRFPRSPLLPSLRNVVREPAEP